MNKENIKVAAIAFETELRKLAANDPNVANLAASNNALIDAAKNGSILEAMEWSDIPGAWWFTEGELQKYGDLEDAFAKFRIEITGGPTPVLEALKESMRKLKPS